MEYNQVREYIMHDSVLVFQMNLLKLHTATGMELAIGV